MYLGFRPLPSELPFLHKRSAPRSVLVRLKQESRVSKIIDIISPPSSRLKRFWTTDEKQTQKITRTLDKTKICPVTTPCFCKDRSHFRKFQWDLQYFPCDLRYLTESILFIWRLGSRAEVSVHAWRGSTVKVIEPSNVFSHGMECSFCCDNLVKLWGKKIRDRWGNRHATRINAEIADRHQGRRRSRER